MNEHLFKLSIKQSDYVCGDLETAPVRLLISNRVTLINDAQTVDEDVQLTGNVLDNDSGSGATPLPLTITSYSIAGVQESISAGTTTTIAGKGSIVINSNGSYTFTPDLNFNGPVPVITYTAQDSSGASSTATLTLNVRAVNDAPTAVDDTLSVAEDTESASGNVLTNDDDVDVGDILTVTTFEVNGTTYNAGSTAEIAGKGSIVINSDGSYTFTPAANFNGPVPVITYTVSDGSLTDTATLSINVTAINDAPIAANDIATTDEDVPLTANVLTNDTDVDGDTLTVTTFEINGTTYNADSTAEIAGKGSIVINSDGSYTFTPDPNFNGPVPVITYTVSDGSLTDTATLSINVTAINDTPQAANDIATTNEDVPLTGNVLTNDTDVDGDTLTVTTFKINETTYNADSTAEIAGKGSLIIKGDGAYTFTPALDYNGAFPAITYTITDGKGETASASLTITVTAVNDPPQASDDVFSVLQNTPVIGNVLTNDSDIDTAKNLLRVLNYTIDGVSGSIAADTTTNISGKGDLIIKGDGDFTFTPDSGFSGKVPIVTYTVSDGQLTDNATLQIVIIPVPDRPVARDDSQTVNEDAILSCTGADPDTCNLLTNDSLDARNGNSDFPTLSKSITQISFQVTLNTPPPTTIPQVIR